MLGSIAFTALGILSGAIGAAGGAISNWILATGVWRDVGVWDDTQVWKDS